MWIKVMIGGVLLVAMNYGSVAFSVLEANPVLWNEGARIWFALMSVLIVGTGLVATTNRKS